MDVGSTIGWKASDRRSESVVELRGWVGMQQMLASGILDELIWYARLVQCPVFYEVIALGEPVSQPTNVSSFPQRQSILKSTPPWSSIVMLVAYTIFFSRNQSTDN